MERQRWKYIRFSLQKTVGVMEWLKKTHDFLIDREKVKLELSNIKTK